MIKPPLFKLSRKKLQKQFDQLSQLADVVSYSAKTNYIVASILEGMTSCDFSVHSIDVVKQFSDCKRVWYFAQGWDETKIQKLIELGVDKFVVDNKPDLEKIKNYVSDKPIKINLLLRMRLKEHTIHTGKYYAYGFPSNDINTLIPTLKKLEQINKLGIHFHRKTQNVSEWSLKKELVDTLDSGLWSMLDVVNIGGGIPVQYKNFQSNVLPNIFEQVKELKTLLTEKKIKMIVECGRFLAAPCITLEVGILNIYDNNIIVNASVYNASMDTFIANTRLEIEGEDDSYDNYTVKGMTPCSLDIFRYKVGLNKPKKGEVLTFLNAGAYTFSTDFCGLKKIKTIVQK
ncbi:decarboxylase [archaeon]|nr:decarboxylase [archaeon]|tara:strand:+ start:1316 stop:2347 length:1032 start_codon:yes stop_codon:yes gene_type:complete